MRNLLSVIVLAVLFSSAAYAAPTVFLKDGTTAVGNAVWTESNKVYLSKSREVFEYSPEEVKQDETLKYNKLGRYQVATSLEAGPLPNAADSRGRRAKSAHSTQAAVRPKKPATVAVASAASATTAAAPAPAASAPAGVMPAPKPAAPSTPAPAPAPVVKEAAPPVAAPSAAADSALPPDKDELERRKKEAATLMTEALVKKDPELMKKALEMQKSAMPQQGAASQKNSGIPLYVPLMILVACLLIVIAQWILFERAGQAGWKCLVPFYNMYIMMEISGKPGWWMFLLLIPFVGVVFLLLAMLSLARKFRRSELFGVGIFTLPMIFLPVLAFGGSEYDG